MFGIWLYKAKNQFWWTLGKEDQTVEPGSRLCAKPSWIAAKPAFPTPRACGRKCSRPGSDVDRLRIHSP